MPCCAHPNGKAQICIFAYVASIMAFVVGMFTLGWWFLGQICGLVTMIILLCTICTRVSKCALVTASVFAFLASVGQILFALFPYYCNSYLGWRPCSWTYGTIIVICSISGVLYVATGVLALFIPVPPPADGSIKSLSGSDMQTPDVVSTTFFALSQTKDDGVTAPEKIMERDDDMARKSRMLSERQSLRAQGVPQEEIDLVFPLPRVEEDLVEEP